MLKAKTSLSPGESISKAFCLTSYGNLIEATGEQLMQILSEGGVNLSEQLAELKASVEKLSDLFGYNVEGYVRLAGVSDPRLSFRTYSHGVGMESVFDCIRPCLIEQGTGRLLYVLNNLNWRVDDYGHERAIDGSEGDVFITNISDIYIINGHVTVNGVTYDVFLRSRGMFEWQGHPAEHIQPLGLSPDYCVAHADSDGVTRMHSAYNLAWNGSYTAMSGIVGKFVYDGVGGDMTESYDAGGAIFGSAAGLPTTNLTLPAGEQYAMNMNADRTKTVPFFNEHAKAVEVFLGHMIAEGGTFDAHKSSLMGSGFCSNDSASSAARWEEQDSLATNGVRYLASDGSTVRYASIGNFAIKINEWRTPWRIFERQRVMFYAMENNIPELTWFSFEGNKYKWRHVDGFAGPSEGVLTCVVWKMFSTKFSSGATDPVGGGSVAGNRIDFLFCSALYRGWNTDPSPARWDSGLIFTEDSNGKYKAYYQPLQSHMLLSSPAEGVSASTVIPFESHYDFVGEVNYGQGYRKDYHDKTLFFPRSSDLAFSGGLHTYVGAYNWFTGGKPSAGLRSVRGFRRGFNASYANLSPFTIGAAHSPSNSYSYTGFGTCVVVDMTGVSVAET